MGIIARYRRIPADTLRVIAAKYLCALVSASFMLAFNLYLRKLGHSDPAIGGIATFQYLGGLLLSFPQGLYVRGRRLKPLIVGGAILVPVLTILVLLAFSNGHPFVGKALLLLLSMALLQVDAFVLPYIVRTHHLESQPEAISLSYSAHAAGTVASGAIIWLMGFALGPDGFFGGKGGLEFSALLVIACASIPAALLVSRIHEPAPDPDQRLSLSRASELLSAYDWGRVAKGLLPTSLLSIGAGLTIPFINLFFNGVFHIDAPTMALIGLLTAALVFITALLVPGMRRKWGYSIAITLFQCLGTLMLIGLALTELGAGWPGMAALAVIFYMLRGPLMNMAGPMSNELVMEYVGRRNQDLAAALHASIWSGGWFISASVFQVMRGAGLPYYQVFLLTASLYVLAIFLYHLLIRDHHRTLNG